MLFGRALQILTGRPLLGSMDLGASGIDAHGRLLMVGRPAELALSARGQTSSVLRLLRATPQRNIKHRRYRAFLTADQLQKAVELSIQGLLGKTKNSRDRNYRTRHPWRYIP